LTVFGVLGRAGFFRVPAACDAPVILRVLAEAGVASAGGRFVGAASRNGVG
jgi:hypothetical protein